MIIVFIHHPVSAKKLVEPIVRVLISHGLKAELWIENREPLAHFISAITCPKRFRLFDLSANPFVVLTRVVRLAKDFVRLKPRAIHANQSRAAFVPLFAGWIAGVPTRIYHNRGTPYLGYRGVLRALLWFLEFLNCHFATHVITVSHSIRRQMIRARIVAEAKCEVLGEGSSCGIDLSQFSPADFDERRKVEARHALGLAPDAYVVLYVGRPVKRKGFHALLKAWQSFNSHSEDEILLIAGCTAEDVIQAAGSSAKNVMALGYVQDLRPCYAACDVVALPSWHEGLPYALLEGAAAARALVGSNVPGIDSIIMRGRNGLLVPPNDVGALAEALLALKGNIALRERMGQASRRYVEQCFDRRDFERLLIDFYHRAGLMAEVGRTPSAQAARC